MSSVPRDVTAADLPVSVAPHLQPESQLDRVVSQFQSAAIELGVGLLSYAELRDLCEKVAQITAALFPGELAIELRGDPEIPRELHFTFEVVARGAVEDIVSRNDEWHREMRRVAGSRAVLFCLSIEVP